MTATTGVVRDCRCKRARHRHGTLRAYVADECRCFRCRWAHANARTRHRAGLPCGEYRVPFAIGVSRRIKALHALGWTAAAMGRELGTTKQAVQSLRKHRGRYTMLVTVEAISDLYERLSGTRPAGGRADQARREAAAHGWAPPLAWDDIDDPACRPVVRPRDTAQVDEIAVERACRGDMPARPLRPAESTEAVRILTARGLSGEQIAELMCTTQRTVTRKRRAA